MTRCCLLIFEIIIENIEVVIRVTLTLFYVLPIILSFSSQPFSSPQEASNVCFTTPFCIESYMVDGFLCWNADSPCSFSVVLPINLLLLLYSLASC